MFLTKDNKIQWKKMCVAAICVALIVLLGILWFDKPLFVLLRNFECGLFKLFGIVFSGKVWLLISFVAVIMLCVKKYLKSEIYFKDKKNNFNLIEGVKNIFLKTKSSHAFLIFYSVLLTGVIVKFLKVFIGRARPIFFEALDMTGFYPPSLDWAFNSMPSGHTAISFAGLVMIGMLIPKYKCVTWSLAILIGFSRIAVGAHWPSDVILGAFIGMVVADIVKWYMLKNLSNKK